MKVQPFGLTVLVLAATLVACEAQVDGVLAPLQPGECLYCGPPGCGAGAWHVCDVREALESACSGHDSCDEPPGCVGRFDKETVARNRARCGGGGLL